MIVGVERRRTFAAKTEEELALEVELQNQEYGEARSKPLSGWKLGLAIGAIALFTAYVVWADLSWAGKGVWPLLVFFSLMSIFTGMVMVAGLKWRSFAHLPVPEGRVIAIVPSYNEEPELLKATIVSLLKQTRVPDEIHVIDDGSPTPMETFKHPLITWHFQTNQGKRYAQATVLRKFKKEDWDYILTVDSDSVVDPQGVEQMLRTMSNPKVQAATGMILMRNWNQNVLTRMVDINVVTSCLMFRMIRSWFGLVSPTSGCLALYRSAIVYDNLDDYVTSGTAGDDRRLSFYALLHGEVVGVPEAVVETELPSTWKGTFHQRTRWSKSAWLGIPFVLTNMRLGALLFYIYPLVFACMWPALAITLTRVTVAYGSPIFLYAAMYWVITAFCMGSIYALYRPSLSGRERVKQWLLGPLSPVFGMLVLRPAVYWAITQLKSNSWHTRGSEHTGLDAIEEEKVVEEKVVLPAAVQPRHIIDGQPVVAVAALRELELENLRRQSVTPIRTRNDEKE